MELLSSARRLGEFPTRFVLWHACQHRDLRLLRLYVDALEDYVAVLQDVCETIHTMIHTLHRAQRHLERQRAVWEANAQRFLEEGKEDLAHMARHRVRAMDDQAVTYERLLEHQKRELAAYQDVRLWLEATVAEVRQRREEIEAWLDAKGPDAPLPDFARPLPEWDEERLLGELEEILGVGKALEKSH